MEMQRIKDRLYLNERRELSLIDISTYSDKIPLIKKLWYWHEDRQNKDTEKNLNKDK